MTLAGVRVQARPALGEVVEARVTVPANPLTEVTPIVEVPLMLARTVTLVGFAAIVKSCIAKVTVEEWDRPLPVPVTVMV